MLVDAHLFLSIFKEVIEQNYVHGSDEQRNERAGEVVRYVLRYKSMNYPIENFTKRFHYLFTNVKKIMFIKI